MVISQAAPMITGPQGLDFQRTRGGTMGSAGVHLATKDVWLEDAQAKAA
jgi:hypothetical protein